MNEARNNSLFCAIPVPTLKARAQLLIGLTNTVAFHQSPALRSKVMKDLRAVEAEARS